MDGEREIMRCRLRPGRDAAATLAAAGVAERMPPVHAEIAKLVAAAAAEFQRRWDQLDPELRQTMRLAVAGEPVLLRLHLGGGSPRGQFVVNRG